MAELTRTLKVGFYDHFSGMAGAEISLLSLLTQIDRTKIDPLFIYHAEGPVVDKVKALGIPVVRIKHGAKILGIKRNELFSLAVLIGLFDAGRVVFELRKLLKTHQVDILHANTLKANLLGMFSAPGLAKLIWHQRDILSGTVGKIYRLLAQIFPDKTICISEAVRKSIDNLRCEVIYNGVPETFGTKTTSQYHDRLTVTMIGRIAEWKNQEVLVRAASELDCDVRLGGVAMFPKDDLYLEHLKAIAPPNVTFLGHINSETEMSNADIVVHASKQPEPFGLVIAEAMACSKPVVASNIGAPKEILGDTGIYFNPVDVADLKAKLIALISDLTLRTELGNKGRQRFLDFFTSRIEARNIERFYTTLY